MREIKEGLRRAREREQYEIDTAEAVRYRDIHRAILDYSPNIVHFSGHGAGEEGLVFEDETGQAKLVDAEALAGLFELFADQIECVVLNACYSEVQARAIAQHINYVIGMSQAIRDRAAIEFAVGFYDALGAGRPVEFAYRLGCSVISLAGIPENLTPQLLTKNLAAPRPTVPPEPPPVEPGPRRTVKPPLSPPAAPPPEPQPQPRQAGILSSKVARRRVLLGSTASGILSIMIAGFSSSFSLFLIGNLILLLGGMSVFLGSREGRESGKTRGLREDLGRVSVWVSGIEGLGEWDSVVWVSGIGWMLAIGIWSFKGENYDWIFYASVCWMVSVIINLTSIYLRRW